MRRAFASALLLASAVAGLSSAESPPIMLVIGNSISRHGPDPSIGWSGDWGMAAGRAEDDYLHQLAAGLGRHRPPLPLLSIVPAQYVLDPKASPESIRRHLPAGPFRYIIVQAAENITAAGLASYRGLLSSLQPALAADGVLVCVGRWWPDAALDALLASACREVHGRFVSLNAISADRRATAKSERSLTDAGVAAHPGDWAMRRIAESVECELTRRETASCP